MGKTSIELEEKAWYRVLKVFYSFGWVAVFLITGLAFFILKPTSSVDLNKSTIYCPNIVTSYSLSNATGWYKRGDKYLNMDDHIMATRICGIDMVNFNKEKAKGAGLRDTEVSSYLSKMFNQNSAEFQRNFDKIESMRKNPKYQINFAYQDTTSNWLRSLGWVAAVFMIATILLNIIRDIVLYITTGKKFSYWWIISDKHSADRQ